MDVGMFVNCVRKYIKGFETNSSHDLPFCLGRDTHTHTCHTEGVYSRFSTKFLLVRKVLDFKKSTVCRKTFLLVPYLGAVSHIVQLDTSQNLSPLLCTVSAHKQTTWPGISKPATTTKHMLSLSEENKAAPSCTVCT
jgi:hypothetical protein